MMRLWIGPNGDEYDLDDMNHSHSMAVVHRPAEFGFRPDQFDSHMAEVDAGEIPFDFDLVIAMAEQMGWVRVSRDADPGSLAISASEPRIVRAALNNSSKLASFSGPITLEIEEIDDDAIERRTYKLDARQLAMFRKFGRLPASGSGYRSPIESGSLLSTRSTGLQLA